MIYSRPRRGGKPALAFVDEAGIVFAIENKASKWYDLKLRETAQEKAPMTGCGMPPNNCKSNRLAGIATERRWCSKHDSIRNHYHSSRGNQCFTDPRNAVSNTTEIP